MYTRPKSQTLSILSTLRQRLARATIAVAMLGTATATTASAATFSLAQTGKADTFAVLMTGPIIPGDAERLKSAVAQAKPDQKLVLMLDSPGGAVVEGMQLGRFVHEKRLITIVPSGRNCESACSFVFLAGRNAAGHPTRILMKDAQLGLHQTRMASGNPNEVITEAKSLQRQSDVQTAIAEISTYFRELSIPFEFMNMMLSAPPTGMYYLRELDALRLGIYVLDGTGRLNAPLPQKSQTASR